MVGKWDKMIELYKIGFNVVEMILRGERGLDMKLIDQAKKDDIVVVRGSYDRIEGVLEGNINHTVLPNPFDSLQLENLLNKMVEKVSKPVLFLVNCSSANFGRMPFAKVIENGSWLFSTDYIIQGLIQKHFRQYAKMWELKKSGDDVVSVQIVDSRHPFVEGMFISHHDPIWWLENSSYFIEVTDPNKVKVLIKSDDMKVRYSTKTFHTDKVMITFDHGMGKVVHMISHFINQRTELRTPRHRRSARYFLTEELGFSNDIVDTMPELEGRLLGEIESVFSSLMLLINIISKFLLHQRLWIKKNYHRL